MNNEAPNSKRSSELDKTVRSIAEFRRRQIGGEAIARQSHPAQGSESLDETLARLEREGVISLRPVDED